MQSDKQSGKNVSHKMLCFPLRPRLKRLFATTKTAKLMWWYLMGKSTNDDVMRYMVNGKAWMEFDKSHPQFANNIRNVQLVW